MPNDNSVNNGGGTNTLPPPQSRNEALLMGILGAVSMPSEAEIAKAVSDWLSVHVNPSSGYVLDDSLTVEGAAADAKAVGDALDNFSGDYVQYTEQTLTDAQQEQARDNIGAGSEEDVSELKSQVTYIEDDIYGATKPVLNVVNNLNLVNGTSSYVSNNSYSTIYLPVTGGVEYNLICSYTTGDVYIRFAFATSVPANGVSCTQIGGQQLHLTPNGYTLEYTPQENGYVSMSVWGTSYFTPSNVTVEIDDSACIKNKIVAISNVQSQMVTDIYGYDSESLTPSVVQGIQYYNASFINSSDYEVCYIPVAAGASYTWEFEKTTELSTDVRMAFSLKIPIKGLDATQIGESYTVESTYLVRYTATNNGYLSATVHKDRMPTSAQTVTKLLFKGLDDKIEDLEETVNGYSSDFAELLGAESTIGSETVLKLNAAGTSDGTFTTGNNYTVKYINVVGGRKYAITLSITKASSQYRMVYSASVPAAGVSFKYIRKFNQTASSTITYNFDYVADADGYVAFAYYFAGGETCNVSAVETIVGFVNTAKSEFAGIKNTAGLSYKTNELFLSPSALSVESTYTEMVQWTVVPYRKAKITVHCPDGIVAWLYLRIDPYQMSDDIETDYMANGDSYVIADGYSLYKIRFCYATKSGSTYTPTGAVSIDDASIFISSGELCIVYDDSDVVSNNAEIEKSIWANINNLPIIAHTSDTHGDAARYANFMRMSDHYGVECAINTGDVVNVTKSDGFQYFTDSIAQYPNIPTIVCLGNHEASYSTDNAAYDEFYKPFDDAYGYTLSTDKTYYYKDFPNAKLRFIVLNIYEPLHPGYQCCIGQDQINWFISALASTPADYGVFVVAHSSEQLIVKDNTYPNFYSSNAPTDWTTRFPNITGNPISTIVDAFISGASITGSYTQNILTAVGAQTKEDVTINYSADFTSKASGAEFIAYINGHAHADMVGYFGDTNNIQLSLNVIQGASGQYYNSQNDIPRGYGRGSVQDAFNLYAVDRVKKKVIVCRIGSNITYDLTDRKIMAIPYAE